MQLRISQKYYTCIQEGLKMNGKTEIQEGPIRRTLMEAIGEAKSGNLSTSLVTVVRWKNARRCRILVELGIAIPICYLWILFIVSLPN